MFYEKQPVEHRENYKNMLCIVGRLSRLFSTAAEPYLYYRAHENIFSKYFDVDNNARSDDSADVYNSRMGIGIGLKTWVGQDNQKVAEFGRLRPAYEHLDGMDLILKIAEYRNARIRTTMNAHGLHTMLYHIVKRVPGAMCIYEAAFDYIDIANIVLDKKRGNVNSTYFTDGKHVYHFSRSKNTLYMIFDDMELLDKLDVDIVDDPYELLSDALGSGEQDSRRVIVSAMTASVPSKDQLCLRLYSTKADGTKFVADKSGLNQWNGVRKLYKTDETTGKRACVRITPRDPNELYIPYPAEDRLRNEFFPPRNVSFELLLPDGQGISAKTCQADSKAIMSNPNNLLGKWLLRDVFELEEGTKVTYEMLKVFGVDSVMFTKLDDRKYAVDFCELGTYEKFYGLDDKDAKLDGVDE